MRRYFVKSALCWQLRTAKHILPAGAAALCALLLARPETTVLSLLYSLDECSCPMHAAMLHHVWWRHDPLLLVPDTGAVTIAGLLLHANAHRHGLCEVQRCCQAMAFTCKGLRLSMLPYGEAHLRTHHAGEHPLQLVRQHAHSSHTDTAAITKPPSDSVGSVMRLQVHLIDAALDGHSQQPA